MTDPQTPQLDDARLHKQHLIEDVHGPITPQRELPLHLFDRTGVIGLKPVQAMGEQFMQCDLLDEEPLQRITRQHRPRRTTVSPVHAPVPRLRIASGGDPILPGRHE